MPPWLESPRVHGVRLDRRAALALHRAWPSAHWQRACAGVSRLGDAPSWLALIALLPWIDPAAGRRLAALMAALGTVNLLLYWALKHGTRRRRPCEEIGLGVRACMRAPDAYSFPSGHTMHAVAFALVMGTAYPGAAWAWGGFAAWVGVSRVVVGLHYPSDVLMGAALGSATAMAALAVAALLGGGL